MEKLASVSSVTLGKDKTRNNWESMKGGGGALFAKERE